MDENLMASMLASTLRVSTPLMLCALAGLLSERSGVVDLGLEGKMLFAAFAAGAVGALAGSITLAVLAAMTGAVLLSMLHGIACVSHRGDQVVSGVAINIIAAGMTVVIGIALFAQGGQTPQLPGSVRLGPLLPGVADAVSTLPWVGVVLGDGLLRPQRHGLPRAGPGACGVVATV
jgi:simple sugar transport system permease protein